MNLATVDHLDEIYKIFRMYPKIFPHIRKDHLLEQIKEQCVIYQDSVVITFGKYKKGLTLGNVRINKGSWVLHQIVNSKQGNGRAQGVLAEFFESIDDDLYLTVRSDNITARQFYDKNGFKVVGEITWKSGEIAGIVYKKFLTKNIFFDILGT